jgi:lactobin A/cerein 7B family class IIb bacteriocin
MLHEPSGIRTLTPEELDEVNGGVGLLAAGAFLVLCLGAGFAVGYYINHHNAPSGGSGSPSPTGTPIPTGTPSH